MNQSWQAHIDALKRFNQWEAQRLRDRPADYAQALSWLSEAWELASKYGPGDDPDHRDRHFNELIRLRGSLRRARLSP